MDMINARRLSFKTMILCYANFGGAKEKECEASRRKGEVRADEQKGAVDRVSCASGRTERTKELLT